MFPTSADNHCRACARHVPRASSPPSFASRGRSFQCCNTICCQELHKAQVLCTGTFYAIYKMVTNQKDFKKLQLRYTTRTLCQHRTADFSFSPAWLSAIALRGSSFMLLVSGCLNINSQWDWLENSGWKKSLPSDFAGLSGLTEYGAQEKNLVKEEASTGCHH